MKPEVVIGTDYVLGDEYCIELVETNRMAPNKDGGTGWHRFQIIRLYRNNHLHEYQEDMGPREKFKAGQFRIMCGVVDWGSGRTKVYQEHTVNEAREMADDMRWNKQPFDVKERFQLN